MAYARASDQRAERATDESVAKIINLHFYIIDKISISFLYKDADMKARYHDYCTEQTFFIQINPAEIRNNNPLVAAIDDFIENHISLEIFSEKCSNSIKGAPAVHAGMMLKVIFYCYASGCYSSRDIEKRSSWDQNVIYLTANRTIDHSTICRFIEKYPDEIRDVFTKMVYVLNDMEFVDYDLVAIDGTKIHGYGSKEFTGNMSEFMEQKNRIEKNISRLMNEANKGTVNQEKKLNRWKNNLQKINSFLEETQNSASEDENTKINLTDRDARLVKDQGKIYIGYNCQTAADSENDLIIGCNVTNSASDRTQLVPMINELKEHQPVIKIVADAGYFSSENIEYAEENNIDLYLPEGKLDGGVQKKRKTADRVTSKDCIISTDDNRRTLTCPGGFTTETGDAVHDHGNFFYRFYIPSTYCANCRFKDKCHTSFKTGKSKRFNVKREYFDSQLARGRMKNKLRSPEGKAVYNQRSCIIEHIFGEIKEYKKFRRFYHRGLTKVNTIWTIVCIAHNFRKLAKLQYG